jgi:hypothetical protein
MRYLCLLYVNEEQFSPGGSRFEEAAAANIAAHKAMADAGVLVDSAPAAAGALGDHAAHPRR